MWILFDPQAKQRRRSVTSGMKVGAGRASTRSVAGEESLPTVDAEAGEGLLDVVRAEPPALKPGATPAGLIGVLVGSEEAPVLDDPLGQLGEGAGGKGLLHVSGAVLGIGGNLGGGDGVGDLGGVAVERALKLEAGSSRSSPGAGLPHPFPPASRARAACATSPRAR